MGFLVVLVVASFYLFIYFIFLGLFCFFFLLLLFCSFFCLFVYNEGKTGNNVKVPQLFDSARNLL